MEFCHVMERGSCYGTYVFNHEQSNYIDIANNESFHLHHVIELIRMELLEVRQISSLI